MFIFNRSLAAVAGALGIAFLMIGLERACDGISEPRDAGATRVQLDSTVAGTSAPVGRVRAVVLTREVVPVPAQVAQLVSPQGNRFQSTSSPSRLQRNPETLPSGVR